MIGSVVQASVSASLIISVTYSTEGGTAGSNKQMFSRLLMHVAKLLSRKVEAIHVPEEINTYLSKQREFKSVR